MGTAPELAVRKLLHRMGYRFRLHRGDLPGKPDIVLPRHGKVIFVHGCFWHAHSGCSRGTMPASHQEFWERKITRTTQRDSENVRDLQQLGWSVLIVWECQVKDQKCLASLLAGLLGSSTDAREPGNNTTN
jgi:DNA mismatch endonuclease (patch repair protein)